ncbi:MAG: acyltransferase [Solobacterium sp.]|nr:acyltransferase [Solobacterium sp.]
MNGKRIEWVDVARGLAMILVIAGHTAAMGSFTRSIIFSFHIPLFFILSGYTFHPAKSKEEFFRGLKKDALHLLVPYVVSAFVITLIQIFYRHNPAGTEFKNLGESLLWASGTGDGTHEPVGILWFLASLFTARQLFSLLYLIFEEKGKQSFVPCAAILSLIGFGIGFIDWNWLIFNLDVSMAAVGFLLAGYEYRRHEAVLNRYRPAIFPFAMIIWMVLMKMFGYIEMSGRWYPEFSLGILEALCGSYMVIWFSQSLSGAKPLKKSLCTVGKASLMIMCVHAVEDRVFSFWTRYDPALMCLARIAVDVTLGLVLYALISKLKNKKVVQ